MWRRPLRFGTSACHTEATDGIASVAFKAAMRQAPTQDWIPLGNIIPNWSTRCNRHCFCDFVEQSAYNTNSRLKTPTLGPTCALAQAPLATQFHLKSSQQVEISLLLNFQSRQACSCGAQRGANLLFSSTEFSCSAHGPLVGVYLSNQLRNSYSNQ